MAKISRRDFLKVGGAALLGLASTRFIPPQDESSYFKAPLLWHGSRSYKNIAITYDDCNSIVRFHKTLDLLAEYPDFKVTFFPVGLNIPDFESKDKGIWKRIIDQGHEIGYHTYEHVNLGVMSIEAALADFDRWHNALETALGVDYQVRFVRPPYDIISPTLDLLCEQRGLVATMFSVGGGGPPDYVLHAVQKAEGGDIVQMHIRTEDYESSKLIFPWLKTNGWDVVSMRTLYDNYLREKINSDGCDIGAGNSLTRTCVE